MKEDKNIEKLIRDNLNMEQVPQDFTNKIMDKIEVLDQQEERALSSIMNKHLIESPSSNFTSNVMASIEAAHQTAEVSAAKISNSAIIGKKAWFVILTCIAGFVVFALTSSAGSATDPGVIQGLLSKTEGLFTFELPKILTNPMFAMSLFALSSLLFADYMIRNRKLTVNLKSE